MSSPIAANRAGSPGSEASPGSGPLFSRCDERRLEDLRLRCSSKVVDPQGAEPTAAPLSPEELDELATLEEKYNAFLDEGVRRLRCADALRSLGVPGSEAAGVANSGDTPGTASTSGDGGTSFGVTSTWTDGVVTAASTLARATYFWGSLVGTAVPAVAKRIGITDQFDHWNFITDRLILGALPVMTQVGSRENHLVQLRTQLEARHQTLGMVVACLGQEEMCGFGVQLIEFAQERHWHEYISPAIEYLYLPMLDGTADVSMDQVRLAVDRLHEVLDIKKQCAYIHCKAGKGRSWMVTVCYLATYGGRTFDNAETLISMARHQVNPSRSQREFAQDFCKKFKADELALKLMQEDVEPE